MRGRGLVLAVAALLICSLALSACTSVGMQGSGNLITETRQIGSFSKLEVSGTAKVYIQQGAENKLNIEAEDNIMPLLNSKVENNQLVLGPKDGTLILGVKSVRYYLTVKELSKVTLNGAVDMEADNMALNTLKIELNGTGTATINGKADAVDVEISGVGKYQGAKFETTKAKIQLNGTGMADVTATSTLDIEINGAGTVLYGGRPKITKNITGLGDLKQR